MDSSRRQHIVAEVQLLRKRRQYLQNKIAELQSEACGIQAREDQLVDELTADNEARYPSACHEANTAIDIKWPSTSNVGPVLDAQFLSALGAALSEGSIGSTSASGAEPFLTLVNPPELSSFLPAAEEQPQSGSAASVARKRSSTGDSAVGAKRLAREHQVSFEQLREHAANIHNHWDRATKKFICPVCGAELNLKNKGHCIRHLLEHLNDASYHPFKCPVDGCGASSFRCDVIQRHAVAVHKVEWNDELKAASVDDEKKALVDSLTKERT